MALFIPLTQVTTPTPEDLVANGCIYKFLIFLCYKLYNCGLSVKWSQFTNFPLLSYNPLQFSVYSQIGSVFKFLVFLVIKPTTEDLLPNGLCLQISRFWVITPYSWALSAKWFCFPFSSFFSCKSYNWGLSPKWRFLQISRFRIITLYNCGLVPNGSIYKF